MKNRTGISSDIHINLNGVETEEDIKLYIRMLRDLLVERGINHYIINGDISWKKEQIDFFRKEIIRQFGSHVQFHYTNGNHDIGKGNGVIAEEYIQGETDDIFHLKNSPIIDEDTVILGMDTLYDYSFFNQDLLAENQATEKDLDGLLETTNMRLFEGTFNDWKEVEHLSALCIRAAEEKIQRYSGKVVHFVSHYMPKAEFLARNPQQDPKLARKNAMMGSPELGEMLEANGVSMCFFGHTHRRIGGNYSGTSYVCEPVGTLKDWKKFSMEHSIAGMTIYTKRETSFVERLIQEYKPSEAVLNLFLQTEETLQFIG